ncbi:MAG: dihydroorotase [Proteobacteria bacterium]|nr:dihydroorotase [Pseudomonadota bacterium]
MKTLSLTLPRPDDWHVHLRDGDVLAAVLPDTARHYARAIVMPNLKPPVTTAAAAEAYRSRIRALLADGDEFEPLMTCYLTDVTDADDLAAGARDGIFTAAKLYPAGATTNSAAGVTDITRLERVFETMSALGLPLLIHGEVVDRAVDVFDRESVFIERVLAPLRARHPALKIVFEHITTAEAAAYVSDAPPALLAATVTPHHLMLNRGAMFEGGIRPHLYCLPVIKRETHRQALVQAVCGGDPHFFLGTDSAPHVIHTKENECGCAGIYNAPVALAGYAEVFAEHDALAHFEAFASRNGPAFYGLPVNSTRITLSRDTNQAPPRRCVTELGDIAVFEAPGTAQWRVSRVS